MNWEVVLVLVLFSTTIAVVVEGSTGEDEKCRVSRCYGEEGEEGGPTIHFPFRLKTTNTSHEQPPAAADDCGYPPAFQLSCGSNNDTIFQFNYLVNTSITGLQLSFIYEGIVAYIDYAEQVVYLEDTPSLSDIIFVSVETNSTPSQPTFPFKFIWYPYTYSEHHYSSFYYVRNHPYTFFNCSSSSSYSYSSSTTPGIYISFLSTPKFRIYAYASYQSTIYMPSIRSCTKMFNIHSHLLYFSSSFKLDLSLHYPGGTSELRWSTPTATGENCEAKHCRFNDSVTTDGNSGGTYSQPPDKKDSDGPQIKRLLIVTMIPGMFFIVLVVVFLWNFIRLDKQRKEYELKTKMFMEDFKALKPTRYSYSDIKKITNQFKHKLGQGGYGSVFKGQISSDIQVAVKILHSDPKANGNDFINEVGTMGMIHHVNVVRLLGYCADGCNRALVYEFQPNHSLEKFVYSRENHQGFIGWKKMQQIALGTAKGIEYLHQGCAQQILHFDIKPHNILLDKNFNPKISDFGLAKLCNKGQSKVSMTMARGTIGYIAPEVFSRNFGKVSAKSDVYSFGMLLLEMVGGKNNSSIDGVENNSEVYFPEWIYNQLMEGRESIIQIENEDDSTIARKLTIVGLWCIGWHPVDRPSMKHVIQMLEGDDCPAMPPNPFSSPATSIAAGQTKSNIKDRLQVISECE